MTRSATSALRHFATGFSQALRWLLLAGLALPGGIILIAVVALLCVLIGVAWLLTAILDLSSVPVPHSWKRPAPHGTGQREIVEPIPEPSDESASPLRPSATSSHSIYVPNTSGRKQ